MRRGTLVAAMGVVAMACSACSGSSSSSAAGHPGATSLGPAERLLARGKASGRTSARSGRSRPPPRPTLEPPAHAKTGPEPRTPPKRTFPPYFLQNGSVVHLIRVPGVPKGGEQQRLGRRQLTGHEALLSAGKGHAPSLKLKVEVRSTWDRIGTNRHKSSFTIWLFGMRLIHAVVAVLVPV